MNSTQQMISGISRTVVAQIAPKELDLFDVTSEAYFRDPKGVRRSQKEQMLAFGGQEAAVFLTPILLTVTSLAVDFMKEPVKVAVSKGLTDNLTVLFKKLGEKLFGKPVQHRAMQPLTADQFAELHKLIRTTLEQYQVAEPLREQIANAVIAETAKLPAANTNHPSTTGRG